jgi:hypothetical protein
MIICVCGGRNFKNKDLVFLTLDLLEPSFLITGSRRGADGLACDWAEERNIPLQVFDADWQIHGRAAGPIRNREMASFQGLELVVAFPGGNGTANMISLAKQNSVKVLDIAQILRDF